MKNEYAVIVKNSQSNAQNVTHAVPAPGSFWGPLKIKATPGARYQLVDQTTGKGPDNIRVKRVGKDLRISFEGRENVDVMITDYYDYAGNEGLTGESERGVLHVYVPESGDSAQLTGRLTDGANSAGFALGQAQSMASSGAAVGALVAVAGFNPLLAAPLALLAVAGAGGGGGGGGSNGAIESGTPPVAAPAAFLNPADDTGVSNSDGITSDDTPSLLVDAAPNAIEAVVTLNGQKYTSTNKNPQGQFIVPITDPLANGVYAYTVEVKDAAGILGPSFAGRPFTVDRSGTEDFPPIADSAANLNVPVQIISISEDTGFSPSDFVTSDNSLVFTGLVGSAFNNNIQNYVEVKLLNSAQEVVASKYIRPELIDGALKWTWDNSSQSLADGAYTLRAQIVDAAGNPVSSAPVEQTIEINPSPLGVQAARLDPADDTGASDIDGITSDDTPNLLVVAAPGAREAVVTLGGREYTSTIKNPQGQFVVPITPALDNGVYPYTVAVKNAAGTLGPPSPGTPFTVDRSGANDFPTNPNSQANKDILVVIEAITNDTGSSRTDFVTSDNTLVFTGSVGSAFNKNVQNFVEVKLLNSAQPPQVIASKYVSPNDALKWTWDNVNQILADGPYTLTAQIVDAAGNPVSQAPVNQAIVVDTNAIADPNAAFPVVISRLLLDSGDSNSDYLTKERELTFEGNIGTTNVGFTGKVLVQVLGADGKIISQNYLDPDASGNWSFDNRSSILGVPNTNMQYVLKASLVDLAGNMMKSTDQSFTVDLKQSGLSFSGGSTNNFSVTTFRTLKVTADELGEFRYSDPLAIETSNVIRAYDPNTYTISFTDQAGNVTPLLNSNRWEFLLDTRVVEEINQPTLPPPSTFGNNELVGSIGRLEFGDSLQTLDLSSRYSQSPIVGGVAAINHIVMTDAAGNDTLKLTTADVLQLGVKNSFLSNGRQQMRIDGDSGDRVELDDLLGGSSFEWTPGNAVRLNLVDYNVYTNDALNLQLLIQQGIITQVL